MAVDFSEWLQRPVAHRIITLEIAAGSGGEEALYFASEGYTTGATDTPAHTHFEGRLIGSPRFSRQLGGVFFSGRQTTSGFSDILITNRDGGLNVNLLQDWDGRAITLKMGDPSWSYADFSTILEGVAGSIETTDDAVIRLPVRDLSLDLDIQIPAQEYTSGDSKGEPIPIAIGDLDNIEPRLVDAANLEYQFEDGSIQSLEDVYDNGVSLSGSPNGWTVQSGNGSTFRLTSNPAGRITVDAQGITSGSPAAQLTTPGEIIKYLLTELPVDDSNGTVLALADVDTDDLDALDTEPGYTLGIYIKERTSLIEVLDTIMASVGGYWWMGRDGKFHAKIVDPANPTSPVRTLSDVEMIGDFESRRAGRKQDVTKTAYRTNWTVQDPDSVAASVSVSRRESLKKEFAVVESGTAAGGFIPDPIQTYIVSEANATTENTRWRNRLAEQQWFYRIKVRGEPYEWDLGDAVQITSEVGISGAIGPWTTENNDKITDENGEPILFGRRVLITGSNDDMLQAESELELWSDG